MEQKEIAQILLDAINKIYSTTIEIDEEFLLVKDGSSYEGRISPHNGFVDSEDDSIYDEHGVFFDIDDIVLGRIEVKQLPFKPKLHEIYFTPAPNYTDKFYRQLWEGDEADNRLMQNNMICRTPEQAIKLCDKMLNSIK